MIQSSGAVPAGAFLCYWPERFLALNPTSRSVPAKSLLILGRNAHRIRISNSKPEKIYSQGWLSARKRIRKIKLPISGKLIVARDAYPITITIKYPAGTKKKILGHHNPTIAPTAGVPPAPPPTLHLPEVSFWIRKIE